jgi:GNAT superfamily N-acetyltransferase
MNKAKIREGKPEDIPQVHQLVCELAEFEKAPDEVTNTASAMTDHGFGKVPYFGLFVAELDGRIIGMAIHYVRYSTWKGPMLYLEDIYVQPEFRGTGTGSALFEACVSYASEKGYQGMTWQVLDWNEDAITFYKKYGSTLDPEWVNGKLNRNQIEELSKKLKRT